MLNSSIQWEIPSSVKRSRHTSAPGSQSSLPDHIETERGPVLTPLGRYQVCERLLQDVDVFWFFFFFSADDIITSMGFHELFTP